MKKAAAESSSSSSSSEDSSEEEKRSPRAKLLPNHRQERPMAFQLLRTEKQARKVRRKRKTQNRTKRQPGPSQVQARNGSTMRQQMKQQLLNLRKLSCRPLIRFQKGRRERKGHLPLSEGSGRRRLRWTLE